MTTLLGPRIRRRQFLRAGVATAAGALILPGRAPEISSQKLGDFLYRDLAEEQIA
jgi:hypothetical protein